MTALFSTGYWVNLRPVLAASPTPGTVITNQASGSFVDELDGSNTPTLLKSNVVQVTVAEVAGITVTATGTSGTLLPTQTVYFTYTITNVGNDPTQFFIPSTATLTGNATQPSNVEITGYSLDGTGLTTLSTPVVVPNGGGQTGRNNSGTAGLLKTPNPNGEFQPNGYITVRIPVLINSTANSGDIITAQLGNTPVDPASSTTPQARQQNIPFNNSNSVTNRVYTVDNPDSQGVTNEAVGNPINGDTTNRRQEASAIAQITVATLPTLSGTVYEDVNYGGGVGRSLSSSSGIGRGGVTVELYDATGTLRQTTTTSSSVATLGQYSFNVAPGSYTVRVVNSTVTSSRPGGSTTGLIPVQTYRTNAATAGTVSAVGDRVGGEKPELVDAGAGTLNSTTLTSLNTSTTQAQSITAVTQGTSSVSGIDFGFNFNTIVNTKDSGQGSLRQFVTNANALGGEASLAQSGTTQNTTATAPTALPSGSESSIFMIPDGTAKPGLRSGLTNQLTSGVARITTASTLSLTGTNAPKTIIDAGTQTANVGNTNTAVLSNGGTVGLSGSLSYTKFDGPEVQLMGGGAAAFDGLTVQADNITVRNVAMRTYKFDIATVSGTPANLLVENNVLGTEAASFTDPGTGTGRSNQHIVIQTNGQTVATPTLIARNNLIGFSENRGIHINGAAANGTNLNIQIYSNEFLRAGNPTQFTGTKAGSIEFIQTVSPFLEIYNNKIVGPGAPALPSFAGSNGIEINNASIGAIPARDGGTAVSGSRIQNNSISAELYGVLIQGQGLDTFAIDGLNITQNRMFSNTMGIVNTGDNQTISQNQIDTNLYMGIYTIGKDVSVTQNQVFSNGNNGINIGDAALGTGGRANGVTVSQNTIYNNLGAGISAVNNGTQVKISQNSTYQNASLGIDLMNNGVTANNGTVSATQPNREIDYPIITSSTLSGGTLTIKGFVGISSSGNATFPTPTIEVFIADSPVTGTKTGEVVVGDGRSKVHAEGKTYIGSCTADANGLFGTSSNPCSFTNAGTLGLTSANNITATATDAAGNTSEFSAILLSSRVLLVKRITAINGLTTNPNDSTALGNFVDDTTSIYQNDDNDPGWPSGYLRGAIDGGKVKPGDEIEYTVYFLNAGGSNAKQALICDLLTANQTYKAGSMNLYIGPTSGGTNYPQTDASDGSDRAQVYAAGATLPTNCNGTSTNTNSTLAVDVVGTTGSPNLPVLSGSTGAGTPTTSFGYFRFKTNVNP